MSKENIHPEAHPFEIVMTNGEKFQTYSASNRGKLHLDICIHSHPAWTGKRSAVNERLGQVASFNEKFAGFASVMKKKNKE
jgi:ribosomal protein L31